MTTMLRRVVLASLIVASIIGGLALIASAYEVTTVSNSGTVEGKVAFTGPKPALALSSLSRWLGIVVGA